MRVGILAVGVCLMLSSAALAQGPVGVGSDGASSPVPEHRDNPWQVAVGYQYNRDNLVGSPFNTHGMNVSVARYFKRWFAVEAGVGVGFLGKTDQTTTPPNLDAKSLFLGAGPHIALPNHTRYEPWIHVLVGWEHYRFSQTAGVLGNNSALAGPAGGGVDIYVNRYAAIRIEADAVGSRFFAVNQRSFQMVGGMAFNF